MKLCHLIAILIVSMPITAPAVYWPIPQFDCFLEVGGCQGLDQV